MKCEQRPEGNAMSARFDTSPKFAETLLTVLLIAALVVPACMTLACMEVAMHGDNAIGTMSFTDCLEVTTARGGLTASQGSASAGMSSIALLGLMSGFALSASTIITGRPMFASRRVSRPPQDPLGVRLLI